MTDVTLSRGIKFRDDFLDVTAWTLNNATFTTDGDIASYLATGVGAFVSRTIPGSIRAAKLKFRTGHTSYVALSVTVTYSNATTDVFTVPLTTDFFTWTFSLNAGTDISSVKISSGNAEYLKIDFIQFYTEDLIFPAVPNPSSLPVERVVPELFIPMREGGRQQDLGSLSPIIELNGIFADIAGSYTAAQWVKVFYALILEKNWQWLSTDLIAYKFKPLSFTPREIAGYPGYFEFNLRLRKWDNEASGATAQSFGAEAYA